MGEMKATNKTATSTIRTRSRGAKECECKKTDSANTSTSARLNITHTPLLLRALRNTRTSSSVSKMKHTKSIRPGYTPTSRASKRSVCLEGSPSSSNSGPSSPNDVSSRNGIEHVCEVDVSSAGGGSRSSDDWGVAAVTGRLPARGRLCTTRRVMKLTSNELPHSELPRRGGRKKQQGQRTTPGPTRNYKIRQEKEKATPVVTMHRGAAGQKAKPLRTKSKRVVRNTEKQTPKTSKEAFEMVPEANNRPGRFVWTTEKVNALIAATLQHDPSKRTYWSLVSKNVAGAPSPEECHARVIFEEESRLEKYMSNSTVKEKEKVTKRITSYSKSKLSGHTKDWKLSHLVHFHAFDKGKSSDKINNEFLKWIDRKKKADSINRPGTLEAQICMDDSVCLSQPTEPVCQKAASYFFQTPETNEKRSLIRRPVSAGPVLNHTGVLENLNKNELRSAIINTGDFAMPQPLKKRASVGGEMYYSVKCNSNTCSENYAGNRETPSTTRRELDGNINENCLLDPPVSTAGRICTPIPQGNCGVNDENWKVTPGHVEMLHNIHTGLTPCSSGGTRQSALSSKSQLKNNHLKSDEIYGSIDVMENAGNNEEYWYTINDSSCDEESGSADCRLRFHNVNSDILSNTNEGLRDFLEDRFLKQHKKVLSKIQKDRNACGSRNGILGSCTNTTNIVDDEIGNMLRRRHVEENKQKHEEVQETLLWEYENAKDEGERLNALEELLVVENDSDDETDGADDESHMAYNH